MADMELSTVESCIEAIVSVYDKGLELLGLIRSRYPTNREPLDQKRGDLEIDLLAESHALGSSTAQGEYDAASSYFGERFVIGDDEATEALKDIEVSLRSKVLDPLHSAWEEKTPVQLSVLQVNSESCRVATAAALRCLYQRLATAASTSGYSTPAQSASARTSLDSWNTSSTASASSYGTTTYIKANNDIDKPSALGLASFLKSKMNRRPKNQTERPGKLTTEFKQYYLPGISVESLDLGWFPPEELIEPILKPAPWTADAEKVALPTPCVLPVSQTPPRPKTATTMQNLQEQYQGLDPKRLPPTVPETLTLPISSQTWPSPENNFSGFCKGAWKLQEGLKGAMRLRDRPAGQYTRTYYWKCQKCLFEGPVYGTESKKGFDRRVYTAECGVRYRWVFLAKSHLPKQKYTGGQYEHRYGCVFCCAEGRERRVFKDVESLMAHLGEHGERGIGREVLERTWGVVGRAPGPKEYFEVCIPPKVEEVEQLE
ncbi:MAG: hypothetical protein M1827_005967 [Pycnora praestabilis]|nr:MAG: hypothetical protein M1827_005967 [Pycnora praestabilis]